MNRVVMFTPAHECANAACTNRIGEGQFGVVTVPANEEQRDSGHRDVVLFLCGPCIAILNQAMTA